MNTFLIKYSNIFSDNLPSRLPNYDMLYYYIILEDENISIND